MRCGQFREVLDLILYGGIVALGLKAENDMNLAVLFITVLAVDEGKEHYPEDSMMAHSE